MLISNVKYEKGLEEKNTVEEKKHTVETCDQVQNKRKTCQGSTLEEQLGSGLEN